MNDKIQEIIRAQAAHITSDFVNDPGRTAQEFRQQAEAHILRAVLEVIGEAGVEGALESSWRSLASVVIASQIKMGASPTNAELIADKHPAVVEARTALRTLKELHQSVPKFSMRKLTDDEAHDIAMQDAFGPYGQG